jgi:transcription antitermination factor NusG
VPSSAANLYFETTNGTGFRDHFKQLSTVVLFLAVWSYRDDYPITYFDLFTTGTQVGDSLSFIWDAKCLVMSLNLHSNWFAVQVRPRSEFATAAIVHNKGFATFLPVVRTKRHWSDRTVVLESPLFPGYIFCNVPRGALVSIMNTSGVIRVVGTRKEPVPILESEIDGIKQIMVSGYKAEPFPYHLTTGSRVVIQSGPLAGVEGILTSHKNRQVVISVDLIQRSVAVEIEPGQVIVLKPIPAVVA